MIDWISRRAHLATLVITFLVAAVSGLYINVLTSRMDEDRGIGLGAAFSDLGMWHAVGLLAFALLALQYRISTHADRTLVASSDDLIKEVLKAAAKSLVFPSTLSNIRGFVKIFDPDGDRLRVHYSYHASGDAERIVSYPASFGVSGQAFTQRHAVFSELPPDHLNQYSPELRGQIHPDIRTVIAAPLMRSFHDRSRPLGVLTFDSTLLPHELGMDRPEAKVLVQQWADVIAQLLIAKGV
ncbi:GAF domain-containing protein [Streptomyces sp. NPDC005820]|uniref:GAF domain-containing protein n=1 Tax=Streptomyces sp. NPDC005820 TaxID=3157069 RepID=UPI003404ED22